MSSVRDEVSQHETPATQPHEVGRRDLIRLAAAGGLGLAALKVLPRKWTKPIVESVSLPVHAQASLSLIAGLYGASGTGAFFRINTVTGAGTLIGTLPFGVTEIEWDPNARRAWAQLPDGDFQMSEFDILTAAAIGSPIDDGAAFNGLEYVGNTLYGTAITGANGPSDLRTLNPVTGASVSIGLTGQGPISGLAYGGGVMYGVTGGSAAANLVRINLATGAATVIGPTGPKLGGLQFGRDGVLYGGGNQSEGGNLYRVSTTTGAATLIGSTGFGSVNGLTLV
jgi:hypothetical protein